MATASRLDRLLNAFRRVRANGHNAVSSCVVAPKRTPFELPDRWKGGRVEKWTNYWKGVARDYREAANDVVQGARNRPRKAVVLTATGSAALAAAVTNPNLERDFRHDFLEAGQLLATVPDSIRNPSSSANQDAVWREWNGGRLRLWNLGVASVLWRDDHSEQVGVYASQCPHLKVGYAELLRERVVDVGFAGRWWMLRKCMQDYDVNPDEWDEQGRPVNPAKL